MCGVVYNLSHTEDIHRDVPFEQMWFGDLGEPMTSTVLMPKVLNVSGNYVIPQSARQARIYLGSDKRLAVEEE